MISIRVKIITLALLLFVQLVTWPTSSRAAPGQRTLVNGSFIVEPGQMRYWTFFVGRKGGRVTGRFRAQGGGRNDIEVLILDPDAFENYRNGHRVNTWYNSGRVTVGTINAQLVHGHYFLVFNNNFSSVSNKAVSAIINLSD